MDLMTSTKILDDPENAEIPDDLGIYMHWPATYVLEHPRKRFVPEQADYSSDSRRKSRFL